MAAVVDAFHIAILPGLFHGDSYLGTEGDANG